MKSNLKEIKILKEFEMPYKIEANALYEKEEAIGFPKSLKNFALEKICDGFAESKTLGELAEYLRD